MQASDETIYTYLYMLPKGELRKELIGYLRQKKKLRKSRKITTDKRGTIPDMISIHERPKELKTLPGQMALSMTYNRGKEMAEHKLFTEETKMKVYFCDPHNPWQRGTNEKTNMLIRDFFRSRLILVSLQGRRLNMFRNS
jgi:IS30 family transposase